MLKARLSSRAQAGFTLVEVMVAMSVLLIGVLGTVTMVDTANSLTAQNKSREGATALGRSVLEIARGIPYKQLNSAGLLTALQAREGFGDANASLSGHQIDSQGFTYTVTPTICSMDDPADKLGAHTEVGVPFCADSDSTATPADRNADDYRRITIQLGWKSGTRIQATTQRAIVSNPVGGLGPTVTHLDPDIPNTAVIATETTTQASYDVKTSTVASGVSWTVNGAKRADATGSDLDWSFDWELGPTDDPTYFDCTYVVQAEAFDEQDRSGAPKALTVTLNRRQPFAPPGAVAGRNLNGDVVDIVWASNPECDIKEYRVYRGTTPGSITDLVCTREIGQPTDCIDAETPGTFPLYYQVVAVDTWPNGSDREGDPLAEPIEVDSSNANPPTAPEGLTVCSGGNPGCLDSEGEPAPAGTAALSWDPSTDPDGDDIAFYRIYRDGDTYDDRFALLFPVPDTPLVFVDSDLSATHTYRVSAVDEHLGESVLSGDVTWP